MLKHLYNLEIFLIQIEVECSYFIFLIFNIILNNQYGMDFIITHQIFEKFRISISIM